MLGLCGRGRGRPCIMYTLVAISALARAVCVSVKVNVRERMRGCVYVL